MAKAPSSLALESPQPHEASLEVGWTLHYHRGHCPMQRLWRAASLRDGVGYTFVPFLQDMKNYADEIERIVESRE